MKAQIMDSNLYYTKESCFVEPIKFKIKNTKKISERELLMYFKSVGEFFKVYENLVTCLEFALHNIHRKKDIFISVIKKVKKGVLFSTALKESGLVPNTIFNIIKSGEKNDDLVSSFNLIVEFLESKNIQKRKLTNALFYPVFTFGVFFLMTFLFSHYIIPALMELVIELNPCFCNRFFIVQNILLATEILLSLSLLFCTFLYCIYHYNIILFEIICMKIYGLKQIFLYRNLYLSSYYISISLKNNLSINESLDIAIESSGYLFGRLLKHVKHNLIKGQELSVCFSNINLIPRLMIDIIKTGENSNNLTNSFETSKNIFKEKIDMLIDNISIFLPIILISVISLLLISFCFFLLFPLYNLGV